MCQTVNDGFMEQTEGHNLVDTMSFKLVIIFISKSFELVIIC